MKEIDEMLTESQDERNEKIKEIDERVQNLLTEPYQKFDSEYNQNIQNLSAKDGLGKTFG
jgi:ElaB/YqjD/DUF883 family membrane-anchored ribosome-binding protein